jgi:sulfur-oxidizing protein SoxB
VAEPWEGTPIWEVVAQYLRDAKVLEAKPANAPKLKNVSGNPGLAA